MSDNSDAPRTRELLWKALSASSAVIGGLVARRALKAIWSRFGDGTGPPQDPADRSESWRSALMWAAAAGVGVGIGRLVSRRLAAAGWEAATGDLPPGIDR